MIQRRFMACHSLFQLHRKCPPLHGWTSLSPDPPKKNGGKSGEEPQGDFNEPLLERKYLRGRWRRSMPVGVMSRPKSHEVNAVVIHPQHHTGQNYVWEWGYCGITFFPHGHQSPVNTTLHGKVSPGEN